MKNHDAWLALLEESTGELRAQLGRARTLAKDAKNAESLLPPDARKRLQQFRGTPLTDHFAKSPASRQVYRKINALQRATELQPDKLIKTVLLYLDDVVEKENNVLILGMLLHRILDLALRELSEFRKDVEYAEALRASHQAIWDEIGREMDEEKRLRDAGRIVSIRDYTNNRTEKDDNR